MLDIDTGGNCLIYGSAGSGKSEFLMSLMYSLIETKTAEEISIFAIDLGNGTLKAFASAPHVGGICIGSETERIENLFKLLVSELELRRRLFAPYGGEYSSYISQSGTRIPHILVLINNIAAFSEGFEDYEDTLITLTRDGVKYGISFIITAATTIAVKYRMQQNFGQTLTMRQNDISNYSIIMGRTEGLVPANYLGRGLVRFDKLYEFQTAYISESGDSYEAIAAFSEKLYTASDCFAKQIPQMPEIVTHRSIVSGAVLLSAFPIGISKNNLSVFSIDLSSRYLYPILGSESRQLSSLALGVLDILGTQKSVQTIIIDCEYLIIQNRKSTEGNEPDHESLVVDMFDDVVTRYNLLVDAKKDPEALDDFPDKLVIISGIKKLFDKLTDDGKDKLKLILENGEAIHKYNFILIDYPQNIKTLANNAWYQKHYSGQDGIWIGDGFTNQTALNANRVTTELYDEIGDEFAYVLSRGKPSLVKLVTGEKMEADA